MKTIISYTLIALLTVCNSNGQTSICNNTLGKVNFDKDQIEDLKSILVFFEKQNFKGSDDIIASWQTFLEQNAQPKDSEDFNINISHSSQKKFLEKFSTDTFDEIWKYDVVVDKKINKKRKFLKLRSFSKFNDYLKEIGKENETIKKYSETLEVAGGISASSIARIAKNWETFNLSDANVKLILSIHYLTINYNIRK